MAIPFLALQFFDQRGYRQDFLPNAQGVWTGSLHLPPVGANLIECAGLYLLQETQLPDVPDGQLGTRPGPMVLAQPTSGTGGLWTATVEPWDSRQPCGFELYVVDDYRAPAPKVQQLRKLQLQTVPLPTAVRDPASGRLRVQGQFGAPAVLPLRILLRSDRAGEHRGRLRLRDETGRILLELELYGEVVGEDERLLALLANFGEQIHDDELYLFRQTDLAEHLPDARLLNAKRKELLLRLHPWKAYRSAYRGLITVLQFFGYPDVRLREYWLQPYTGKYLMRDVPGTGLDAPAEPGPIPGAPYQKTAFFGLFYDLNRVVPNEFDEDGIPVVVDAFNFSHEEVLIKLFGLRQYLQKHRIGGLSRVLDVVGEGSYFKAYHFRSWHDRSELREVRQNREPKFELDQTEGYLRDLRPELPAIDPQDLPDSETSIADFGALRLSDLPLARLGDFTDAARWRQEKLENEGDRPELVGFPIELRNRSFDLPWDDARDSWERLGGDTGGVGANWENLSHLQFYEIEWEVLRRIPAGEFPAREFRFLQRGQPAALARCRVVLPYEGEYDLSLTLHGYGNETAIKRLHRGVTVRMPDASFLAFYRLQDPKAGRFDTSPLTWAESAREWTAPITDPRDYQPIERARVASETFGLIPFLTRALEDDRDVVQNPLKPRTWEELPPVAPWGWAEHLTFDLIRHETEQLCFFRITQVGAGSLRVGEDLFQFGEELGLNRRDFARVARMLNEASSIEYPELRDFAYEVFPQTRTPEYLIATARFPGSAGTPAKGVAATGLMQIGEYQEGRNGAFALDDLRIESDDFVVPTLLPVLLCTDDCEIAGRSLYRWSVTYHPEETKIPEQILADYSGPAWLFYPPGPGLYDLHLDTEDAWGNPKSVTRPGFIRVLPPEEFEAARLLVRSRPAIPRQVVLDPPQPPAPQLLRDDRANRLWEFAVPTGYVLSDLRYLISGSGLGEQVPSSTQLVYGDDALPQGALRLYVGAAAGRPKGKELRNAQSIPAAFH